MVVSDASIRNIMEGMESTAGVRLHNHRRKLKQRFDIIKKLGQGTYGKVQLGINKETGQEVAIKTIKKAKIETEADLIRIRREIQIMSSVQHPNIIHIYEVFENREKMVLVMEYAAGGELYDYLSDRKVLTEEESRRIFRQIATAVYYCHKHKICHRDLKLENILLDEHGSAKIADFGLSNVFNDQRLLSTFCGSPLYASPEIVKGTPYHGPEVDCWSLGVLLYTLVYGAMPFDGSNFKRLVRQISNGDYFEPKKPSPASPLIKDMLNVVPARRADIEKICSHWWVNQGHEESCLDVAEELANQTPVRLDLLLSLAPPGPGVGSDKLMVGGEDDDGSIRSDGTAGAPARSHSVGSLMELDHPTVESKIREFQADKRRGSTGADYKDAPKRKLEEGISTEDAARGGAKRKDRSRRRERERSSERRQHRSSSSSKHDAQRVPLKGGEEMDVDVPPEGATALPAAEEREPPPVEPDDQESPALESPVQDVPARKTVKKKNKPEPESKTEDEAVRGEQGSEEQPSRDEDTTAASVKGESTVADSEPSVGEAEGKEVDIRKPEVPRDADKGDDKTAAEASEKDNEAKSRKDATKAGPKKVVTKTKKNKSDLTLGKLGSPEKSGASTPEDMASPTRVVERRRSKIFETAEKFNSLLSGGSEPVGGKPKKMFIPGVKVSDAKQAFERKSSLSGPSVPSPGPVKSSTAKKVAEPVMNGSSPTSTDVPAAASTAASARNGEDTKSSKLHPLKDTDKSNKTELVEGAESADKPETMVNGKSDLANAENEEELDLKLIPALRIQDKSSEQAEARVKKLKEAREIISNAISEENKKDIADVVKRIAPGRPPVPAVKTKPAMGSGPASPTQVPEKKIEPERNDAATPEKKSSKVEITLKSATLPRRKTSKAEIKLEYPNGKVPLVEFRTEVAQMVGGATLPMTPNRLKTQRSEVAFPVAAAPPSPQHRSASLEPEGGVSKDKPRPREHIIPIQVEAGSEEKQGTSPGPPAARPPVPPLQHQRSQRSSLSRQSTADSDTDSTISVGPEPIRKSPREYIIPIAVEGGGYVTPRAGSLEPSTPDQGSEGHPLGGRQPGKLSRPRRMSSLLGDSGASEDEGFNSAFGTLHRHGDNPDEDRPFTHMHRLRSSRPRKHLEHTDSVSSAEEDDDDDNFEILTAESLFSTLLSRVRSLTQRLNVEDGMRPGFQSSRLLSQLANSVHPSSFISSVYGSNPSRRTSDSSHFSRSFSRDSDASTPWRRSISVSRDASDAGGEPKRASVRVTVHVPVGRGGRGGAHLPTATH
ncbi:serine/threonine-protein kinase par-1 isoform X2 [Bacillus rossius redtenbacheri]|uniref:serine/threonine-protein kinase par-1 isoform X2 n=1 Tax=Bacillus rossius redtenbacheri TaxID=93214 RepID=UPI002FDEE2AF